MPQTPAEKLEEEAQEMPLPVAVATTVKIGKKLLSQRVTAQLAALPAGLIEEEDKDD